MDFLKILSIIGVILETVNCFRGLVPFVEDPDDLLSWFQFYSNIGLDWQGRRQSQWQHGNRPYFHFHRNLRQGQDKTAADISNLNRQKSEWNKPPLTSPSDRLLSPKIIYRPGVSVSDMLETYYYLVKIRNIRDFNQTLPVSFKQLKTIISIPRLRVRKLVIAQLYNTYLKPLGNIVESEHSKDVIIDTVSTTSAVPNKEVITQIMSTKKTDITLKQTTPIPLTSEPAIPVTTSPTILATSEYITASTTIAIPVETTPQKPVTSTEKNKAPVKTVKEGNSSLANLRAGLADILCAFCQRHSYRDCILRYCTNTQPQFNREVYYITSPAF